MLQAFFMLRTVRGGGEGNHVGLWLVGKAVEGLEQA